MTFYIIGAIASAMYYVHYMSLDEPYFIKQIFKVIPMLFIILLAYRFYDLRQESYARSVIVALILIACGTATLPYFLFSLLFFAAGQLYFLRAFFTVPWKPPSKWLLVTLVMLAAIIIGWVVGNIMKDQLYMLSLVISLYIAITLTMLWASFHTRQWIIIVATLCFDSANLLFAINNFITPLSHLNVLMMTPYYCSALLFSLSIVNYFGLPNKVLE